MAIKNKPAAVGGMNYTAPKGPKLNRSVKPVGQVKHADGNTSGSATSMSPCNHGKSGTQHKG